MSTKLKAGTATSGAVIDADTTGNLDLVSGSSSQYTASLPLASGTVMVSGNMPAFIVRLTSNQGSTGSVQIIQFDVKVADTGTCYNNTASTVTLNGVSAPQYSFAPNVAGYYQINACLPAFDTVNGNSYLLYIYKNGSSYAIGSALPVSSGTSTISGTVSQTIYMNGTSDYIQIYGRFTGTSPVYFGGANGAYFSGCLVRNG